MKQNDPLVIGITMGDPAGIAPEIVTKLCLMPIIEADVIPVILGDAATIRMWATRLGTSRKVETVRSLKNMSNDGDSIKVLQIGPRVDNVEIGKISAQAGAASMAYNEEGASMCTNGYIDALLTSPVTKASAKLAGYHFVGQAEFFAERAGSDFVTVLMYGKFWSALLTTHVSLAQACRLVKKEAILEKLRFIRDRQTLLGFSDIRIGVASLNPHAGEAGNIGREEIDEITPAIETARAEGIHAEGPFPVNALFSPPYDGRGYDITLAMHHDQVVARMNMNETTTLTFGLPFIRTSVGHGSALDIAGKGIADPKALAITFDHTVQLARARRVRLRAAASESNTRGN
jgi:4-phospho-D-threonate 3-dehydrogenase / 4-phospho-D-erythronate 3-dehydrogenase